MDCIDAIIFTGPGAALDSAALAGTLGRQLERAGLEVGNVELRVKDRIAEGRALVLLLPRSG